MKTIAVENKVQKTYLILTYMYIGLTKSYAISFSDEIYVSGNEL